MTTPAPSQRAPTVAPPVVTDPRIAAAPEHAGGALSGLWVVLALGLLARVALSFTLGHRWDLGYYLDWMRGLAGYGLAGFYHDSGVICDYPPLYVLVLRGFGAVLSWFDPQLASEAALRVWLRLPACLADVGIALLLFFEGRRLVSRRAGVVAAALYFLNPATAYVSAYWGQTDSIHSALVLLACVALNRWRPALAGVAIALSILQKLQAITFLPLVLLDVYHQKRWRGLLAAAAGMAVAAAAVLSPFAATGTLRDVLTRGYVNVIGQNPWRSFYAFNLWYLAGDPGARDDRVPAFLLPVVAAGDAPLSSTHWIAFFTWRRLALGLFALAVAAVLAAYSRRSSPAARSLAAGLLALVFFLLPTQMHERYLFPVLAVLPLWALGNAWRERVYALLSILFLLNLTLVLPVGAASEHIAALSIIVCAALLFCLVRPGRPIAARTAVELDAPHAPASALLDVAAGEPALDRPERLAPSKLACWFRRLTVAALAGAALVSSFVAYKNAWLGAGGQPDRLYLSTLTPTHHTQGYGALHQNASVDGSALQLAGELYPRGVGTHAPFELVYDLPAGYSRFVATVGVNRLATGRAQVRIYLDDRLVQSTVPLRASAPPVVVELPLGNARQLKLTGLDLGDKNGDQVDLADAHLEK